MARWWLGLVPSCCTLSACFPSEGGQGFGFVVLLRPPEGCCVSGLVLPRLAAGLVRGEAIVFQEDRE